LYLIKKMETNKYSKGKIYMIMTENSSDIYVGSTIQTLKARLEKHESKYRIGSKYCSSQEILKQGDYKIVLIKNYPCSSKLELLREEGEFQRDMECINKKIAGRTKKEWYEDNRDARLTKQKEHYINNREVIIAYQKEYHIKNREALLAKNKVKYECACGGRYTHSSKSRHFKTKKHQNHIKIIT